MARRPPYGERFFTVKSCFYFCFLAPVFLRSEGLTQKADVWEVGPWPTGSWCLGSVSWPIQQLLQQLFGDVYLGRTIRPTATKLVFLYEKKTNPIRNIETQFIINAQEI